MTLTRLVCAVVLAVVMVAMASPAAAGRLEVSIAGRAVHEGVQTIVVTAADAVTEPAAPTAIVTLAPGAAPVRLGDALHVGASGDAGAAVIFKGEVVGIEPIFAVGGEARVIVRALDRMHRLLRGRKSRTFERQRDSDIVAAIAKENGLVPAPDVEDDVRYDHVFQHNQTDLEFLRTRAARIGYEVLVDDTRLVFRRRLAPRVLALGCDGSADVPLRAFHPRLSSAQQVTKVTVRGWDPERKEEIVGVASVRRLAPSRGAVVGIAVELGAWPMLSTAEQSHAVAKAMLEDLTADESGGEVAAGGDPRLMPGARVRVDVRALAVFAGDLEVTDVLHRQGRAAYVTLLKFRRADRGWYSLPEIGDEVLVAFEGGDIDRPIVIGSLWNDRDRIPTTACDGRR